MRTKIKICGITRLEDAMAASDNGVDALGFVFHDKSPRFIQPHAAHDIIARLPPFITTVGLFCNDSKETVTQCIRQLDLDCLQFHGNETQDFCQQFNRTYIKGLRVSSSAELIKQITYHPKANAILLDSHSSSAYGGTGKTFDWDLIPRSIKQPMIVAGGINIDNLEKLLATFKPYAVDLSSGVEDETPGVKNHTKIRELMKLIN